MVSRIGSDRIGKQVEQAMRAWGMDCSAVQIDADNPTGTVEVSFNDGEPSYEIVDGVAYDYIDTAKLPKLDGEFLLYHGSLALRHAVSANALLHLKEQCGDHRIVDINLRSPWWKRDKLCSLMQGADWVKLNEEELSDIYPLVADRADRIAHLSAIVRRTIVLTGGESGATAISIVETSRHSVVPEQASEVVDTVGAGDAFCSVFLAGQLLGWSLELTMQRAQTFASAVVGIRGATSQDKDFYRQFTQKWDIKDHENV